MADAVAEKGYAEVAVADVLKRAGVSRTTFYEQFAGKQECFLAAFDLAAETVFTHLSKHIREDSQPATFDRLLDAYLDLLAKNVSLARVFLVDVHAAGPEAFARRAASQQRIAALAAKLYGVRSARARFACEALVAAVSMMVSTHIATHDLDGLRSLHAPLTTFAHDLMSPHLGERAR